MKLEQLEQLIRIVEAGSMNKAAQEMYTARSSLSTSMKNLEQELGNALFSRSGSGVVLTDYGAEVYHQAKEICEKIAFLQKPEAHKARPSLFVSSMYCSLACKAMIALCRDYCKEKLIADLNEASLMRVVDAVETGMAELGVISLFYAGREIALKKLETLHLEFHPILDRRLYAVVGPNNPFYDFQGEAIRVTDLVPYPYVVNYGSHTDFAWSDFLEGRGSQRADIQASDLACALRIIEETDGYLIETYDEDIYRELYAPAKYRFIPFSGKEMTCQLGWIKRSDRALSPVAEAYLRLLIEFAKQ